MKIKLKDSLSTRKTLILLSLFSILSALTCVLSDIALPGVVAFLTTLLCLEQGNNKKPYSFATIVSILLINVVSGLFIGQILMFWGILAVALAFIISRYIHKDGNKMECVFVCTIIYSFFIVLSLAALAVTFGGATDVKEIMEFYGSISEIVKEYFVSYMNYFLSLGYFASELEITTDMLLEIYDILVSNVISYIVIASFLMTIASIKLFKAIAFKCADNRKHILEWKFATPSLYAYFFVILAIATIFATDSSTVFTVCVSNLYNIFKAVYAYAGITFVYNLLTKKMKGIFAILIIGGAIITLSVYVFEVLAIFGAFFTIRKNKQITV